mmetsp:Transcript_26691/g.70480  ORF Transcript_26691/g.70480 Transcript_26691/m.70480 type:complete len:537 (+) Transcript_26691:43-1653(+)
MLRFALAHAVWASLLLLAARGAQAADPDGSAALAALAALGADDECAAEDAACALNALQMKGLRKHDHGAEGAADKSAAKVRVGCHTMTAADGGKCWSEIMWAKNVGVKQHPDWYPGLDAQSSSIADWQAKVYNSTHSPCPRPCGMEEKLRSAADFSCNVEPPAPLWAPAAGTPVNVKVLSYNLFWWSLFRQRNGDGDSAGHLIKDAGSDVPFDVMGFQECEDPVKVLGPVGLLDDYEAFQGVHAICVAYRKATWELIDHGQEDVAQDMRTEYYGTRGAQWMRLSHKATGQKLIFLNHHGPLSVNSGGECGGKATAWSLIDLMHAKGQPGDLIILVGDFNANAASLTVQSLWPHMVQVYNGDSFGGVDNIFSNVASGSVVSTKTLGSGGSDHHAIEAVVATGNAPIEMQSVGQGGEPHTAIGILTGAGAPGDAWESFWCGLLENGVQYTFSDGGSLLGNHDGIADPRMCCKLCQRDQACVSYVWTEWSSEAKGARCSMQSSAPSSKQSVGGFVSGLSVTQAAKEAGARASLSIESLA